MHRAICRISSAVITARVAPRVAGARFFSDESGDGGDDGSDGNAKWSSVSGGSDGLGWDSVSSWSTGLTKDHFDGGVVGQRTTPGSNDGGARSSRPYGACPLDDIEDAIKELEAENRKSKAYVNDWDKRFEETYMLLKKVEEPGVRGAYLKDSEKAEMYRLHKENPEVYNVERLAKDYRIMRQRVHAILWLKEDEEKMEKKLGHPLDDSVEQLLDTCPEFFNSHDREFHVASLPYKPDFKVMPEGWDGTTRDPDEVHYEISKKEDDMLYEEFVQRFTFNKMKMERQVKCHKYSRRRPDEGWDFLVEKLGIQGKRGDGGGWKFVSKPDGSNRPLNETEKIYLKREKPRRRRRWWWQEVGKQGA